MIHFYYWIKGFRFRNKNPKSLFTEIYSRNLWKDSETRSGDASTLQETEKIRAGLPGLLKELEVKSILDAPCGDFNWMRFVDLCVDYIGVDIVDRIIKNNIAHYARPGTRFEVLDILIDPLPTVDLILCRDCLIHFSFQHIRLALRNFKASESRFLATTTFTGTGRNFDIITGSWRPLNLELPPFNFPPPIRLLNENSTLGKGKYADRSIGVWRIADIPEHKI